MTNNQQSTRAENTISRFVFTGSGKEYFKIWAVNLLLSLITLGIYSAWAKVRTNQYFYSNTRLDNASFNYTAKPIPILLGRLLLAMFALVLFIGLYNWHSIILQPLLLIAYALVFVVLLALLPWIIISAMYFKATNTVYRNIHFYYQKNYYQALKCYILFPILVLVVLFSSLNYYQQGSAFFDFVISVFFVVTVLFSIAYFFAMQEQLKINYLYFGVNKFNLGLDRKSYMIPIASGYIGASIFITLISLMLGLLIMKIAKFVFGITDMQSNNLILSVSLLIFSVFSVQIIHAVAKADIIKLSWNNTSLGPIKFSANYDIGSLVILVIKNTFMLLITLGLYYPFARVNLIEYRLSRLVLVGELTDDLFKECSQFEQSGYASEAVFDAVGLEIGL